MSETDPVGSSGTAAADPKAVELEARAAAAEARAAELQKEIDDAVKRRKAEQEKAKTEAEKRGEYEKAKEQLEADLADAKKRLDEALKGVSDLEPFKAKYVEYEKQRRAELLAIIPEEQRKDFENDDIASIEKAVRLIPEHKKTGVDTGKSGNYKAGDLDALKWGDMTREQRNKWSEGKTSDDVAAKMKRDGFTLRI